MKKTSFNGYVYDFSVDYDATDNDDIKDIHNYLMKKNNIVSMKIFGLIKKIFFLGLTILLNLTNALDCISMKNSECKVKSEIIRINSNNPMFYPFSIKVNKCSGNCNDINDPYARICVPDIIKKLNVKVFNLMPRTNKTKFIKWHEKCKRICRLDKVICNNKQKR